MNESDNTEVIKFFPWSGDAEEDIPNPVPSVRLIPEKYKSFPRWVGEETDPARLATIKHCMPFFDAMSAGYCFVTHADIEIKIVSGEPVISSDYSPIMFFHTRDRRDIPTPFGCYEKRFTWVMRWGMKVPEGWSLLITPPLNHTDYPFYTTSGIVDYDEYISPGDIGFFVKKGFEGVIKAGTPMFQLIPIKRANWVSEIDRSLIEPCAEYNRNRVEAGKIGQGNYKKNYRKEKKYE